MSRLILLCVFIAVFSGCSKPGDKIVSEEDYHAFITNDSLPGKKLAAIDTEILFWKDRLEKNADDLAAKLKLASLLSGRFDYSGNVSELHQADSLYKMVHGINKITSSATYRSLAYLSIKQHEFRLAKQYLDSALAMGDDRYETVLALFDVEMELGNTAAAEKKLNSLVDKTAIPYMIRLAKLEDHKGNLDKAITIIEAASEKVNEHTELPLYLWINSNLADMYSHANRFEKAYRSYLKVLHKDPAYYHCLKGIAWLAFSHDNNPAAAKNILQYLKKKHPVPDYDLLLAEIAAYEKNNQEEQRYTSSFINAAAASSYGKMYNKYMFNLQADFIRDNTAALRIAETEVNDRPTTESFALLAWAYYHSNDIENSLRITRQRLENKSFEPDVIYKIGMIYHAAGERSKARKYLELAYESSYELGPVLKQQIAEVLRSI